MFAARRLVTSAPLSPSILSRCITTHQITTRNFHPSPVFKMVKVGDKVPDVTLVEGAPDKKVSIAQELASGRGTIIGVPAAFSPGCSQSHIPGYINNKNLKNAGKVFVVSVNDPFVMGAWAESLDAGAKSGIRFLGDPSGEFTKELDLFFESAAVFGQNRSKRYALVTEDGKITAVHVEPDNTGIKESSAEKVLG